MNWFKALERWHQKWNTTLIFFSAIYNWIPRAWKFSGYIDLSITTSLFILSTCSCYYSIWCLVTWRRINVLNKGSLDVLPDGCLVNILAKLENSKDRAAVSLVCKRWLTQTQAAFTQLKWKWYDDKTSCANTVDATALLSRRFPNLQKFEFANVFHKKEDIESEYQNVLMALANSCHALQSLSFGISDVWIRSVARNNLGLFEAQLNPSSISASVLARIALHGSSLRCLSIVVSSVKDVLIIGRTCPLIQQLVLVLQGDDSQSTFSEGGEEIRAFEKLLSSLPCLEDLSVEIWDRAFFYSALEVVVSWAGGSLKRVTLAGHPGLYHMETPSQQQQTVNAIRTLQRKCPLLEHLHLSSVCQNASMMELTGPPGETKKLLLTLPLSSELVRYVIQSCPTLEEVVLLVLEAHVRPEQALMLLEPVSRSLKHLTISYKGAPAASLYLTLLPEQQQEQQLKFPELTYLEINKLELEHKEIAAISRGCPKLEELVITCGTQPGFTGEAFAAAGFPNLRCLQLKELRTHRIGGVGAGCPRLKVLHVSLSPECSQDTKVQYGKQLTWLLKQELKKLSLLRCTFISETWTAIRFAWRASMSCLRDLEFYYDAQVDDNVFFVLRCIIGHLRTTLDVKYVME